MTTTLERPVENAGPKPRPKGPSLVAARPQVNLLPPEIHAARKLSRIKRWLAAVVILAVVLSAGLVALAVLTQRAADAELAFQTATTEALLAEQQEYAEVPVVLSQLDGIKTARELTMSTEVLWQDYLAAIAATAPAGVSIETVAISAPSPMEVPITGINPLEETGVATITFSANSATVPDTAQWVEALAGVPGLASPWFTSATIAESEGIAYYSVSGTVQVDASAQAQRFVENEGEN